MPEPSQDKPYWSLPYSIPDPDGAARIGRLRIPHRVPRVAAYVILLAAAIVPIVQLEVKTLQNKAEHEEWIARRDAGELTARQRQAGRPKGHKGAVARWASQVQAFWQGENIYVTIEEYGRINASRPPGQRRTDAGIRHPNMPFVVILLTPFAYMPQEIGALAWTFVKLTFALAGGLAAVRFCNDRGHRMGDWVVGLAVAWWILLCISDIQHANTNLLVLGFIGLHLGFYRRGHDLAAGASLAVAICLKMTPALFVLYWLYQRSWKLLIGCLVAGVLLAVVLPAALVGPAHYAELTQAWLDTLIFEGAGGAWYPIHVNHSLPGTVGRYLLGGQPGGDYNWAPDDVGPWENMTAATPHRWIAFASLSETTVLWIIRLLQLVLVGTMAWAIGWRKLPRDDGRRGLHVAMILPAMMLLNQRTWDHHAVVLLPAFLGIWYALAYGRLSPRVRVTALVLTILAGLSLWLSTGELLEGIGKLLGAEDEKTFANHIDAYGPRMYTWLLTFAAATILCIALRKVDEPYAEHRQHVLV
jgi:hypothetical protein